MVLCQYLYVVPVRMQNRVLEGSVYDQVGINDIMNMKYTISLFEHIDMFLWNQWKSY